MKTWSIAITSPAGRIIDIIIDNEELRRSMIEPAIFMAHKVKDRRDQIEAVMAAEDGKQG